jgi:CRP-like cAMP-binding protein
MLHIIALLCARLRRSTGYIEDSAFLGLATRLAKQLVVLIHNGQGRPGEAIIRISQAELANMLGVSRERVSRQLTVWSEAGILVQGRGMIIVRDEQALKRVTGGG